MSDVDLVGSAINTGPDSSGYGLGVLGLRAEVVWNTSHFILDMCTHIIINLGNTPALDVSSDLK